MTAVVDIIAIPTISDVPVARPTTVWLVTFVFAAALAAIATVIGTSYKRILIAHEIIFFIDFSEAPLQCMLFFDSQIQTMEIKKDIP